MLKIDFNEIKGLYAEKRAIEIALTGNHSIILIGEHGSGKNTLMKATEGLENNFSFRSSFDIVTRQEFNSLYFQIATPCRCGNLYSNRAECTCAC